MRNILGIVFIFISLAASSQTKLKVKNQPKYDYARLHFGFTVGINTMDFAITNSDNFLESNGDEGYIINNIYSIENNSNVGIHLGPISNLRLGNYFDLRLLITLSFGQRNLRYKVVKERDENGNPVEFKFHEMNIESTFLEFPLLLKYKSQRVNNHRWYVIGGVNTKFDLAAKKKIKDEEMPKIRLKGLDFYYEIGSGIDMYMPYFKFAIELKFAMGLRNLIIPINVPEYEQYTSSMKTIFSKMWVLSFHFE